jgi:hypothetical protein
VAYKLGLDPRKDLHTKTADSLGAYVNSLVRRFYDSADFPEWTRTEAFAPDARHIVPYKRSAVPAEPFGRTFKLYLNDPAITPGPLEYPYRLTEEGIHCGFEHGRKVWIKSIPRAPEYTAKVWDPDETYRADALVYSPVSREVYVSNSGGNQGHDPTGEQGATPAPLDVLLIQSAEPETPEILGRTQITRVTQATELLDTYQTQHVWDFLDASAAVIASVSYLTPSPAVPAEDILTQIHALLLAEPALDAFTFILDTPTLSITAEANQWFGIRSYYYSYIAPPAEAVVTGNPAPEDPNELVTGDDDLVVTVGPSVSPPLGVAYNTINNLQYFVQPVALVPAKQQIIQLNMTTQSAIRGASYDLTFIDTAGALHEINYLNPGLSSVGILQGIVDAIQASSDPFFNAMSTSLEPTLLQLKFGSYDMVSLNADIVPHGNPWWTLRPLPLALADAIIRGTYGEELRTQGKSDKADLEEKGALAAAGEAASKQISQAADTLTDQLVPRSRYRLEVGEGEK